MITAHHPEQFSVLCCETSIKLIEQAHLERKLPSRFSHFQLFLSSCIDEPLLLIARIKRIGVDTFELFSLPFKKDQNHKFTLLKYKFVCVFILGPFDLLGGTVASLIRITSAALGILLPKLACKGWLKAELIEKYQSELKAKLWIKLTQKNAALPKPGASLKPEQIHYPNLITPAVTRHASRLRSETPNPLAKTDSFIVRSYDIEKVARAVEIEPQRALRYLGSERCLNLIATIKNTPETGSLVTENDRLDANIRSKFKDSLSYLNDANPDELNQLFSKTYGETQPNPIVKLLTRILRDSTDDYIEDSSNRLNRCELKIFHEYVYQNAILDQGRRFFVDQQPYTLEGYRFLADSFREEYISSYKYGRVNVYI